MPVDKAMIIIRKRLSEDVTLSTRTELSVEQLCQLLEFCLNTTYFLCNDHYYQQCHGAAMGSPVSPIIADIYMEEFEKTALTSAINPPLLWLRYVDDTFVLLPEKDIASFTDHINSIDPCIKFTIEPETNGILPFLDLCIHVNEDGSTKLTIYRKPTHTDQYLNFSSNHPLQHKQSVARTLLHRAEKYITDDEDCMDEINHVRNALRVNGYEDWIYNQHPHHKPYERQNGPTVAIPYIKGLSEKLRRTYKSHGVNSYMKPFNTIRNQLVKPKDRTPLEKQSCVIYQLACDQNPDHIYIGETKRTFGTRLKEHKKLDRPTAVGEHTMNTGHTVSLTNSKIIGREQHWYSRKIKESINIRKQRPLLNRDGGVILAPVYNQVLSRKKSTNTSSVIEKSPE